MTPFSYSQNLINKTIEVFKKEDGLEISAETACEYLDSLGGLFLAFANKEAPADAFGVAGVSCCDNHSPRVDASFSKQKTTGGVGPDLITPHSCNN